MKRWIIFLGRGGTVLLTIGLALLLISLIPSAEIAVSGLETAIPPKWVQPSFEHILTPQQGLRVTITVNGTLDVYILEITSQVLYQLAPERILNVTDLEEFLEVNPDVIGWHETIQNGETQHEYVPTKVTNTTLVFANPGLEYVPVDVEVSITSLIAPGAKVRNLALWVLPIGLVLSLPWFTQLRKEKKTL